MEIKEIGEERRGEDWKIKDCGLHPSLPFLPFQIFCPLLSLISLLILFS
jgi:hypothetical protein